MPFEAKEESWGLGHHLNVSLFLLKEKYSTSAGGGGGFDTQPLPETGVIKGAMLALFQSHSQPTIQTSDKILGCTWLNLSSQIDML